MNKLDARGKAEQLIDKLLFSDYRRKINEEHETSRDKTNERERVAYVTSCAKQRVPVDLIHLEQITDRVRVGRQRLAILERDAEFVEHLVHVVLHVCEIVERYGTQAQTKLCIDSLTLATLYMMQKGYARDGVSLLPRSPLLCYHLPIMNHLSKFRVEKNKFTKGEQHILFSYDAALRQGISLADLCVRQDLDFNARRN